MNRVFLVLFLSLILVDARGAALPGFAVRRVGPTLGFGDSIVVDSRGTIYYTTQEGDVFRMGPAGDSHRLAHVDTVGFSDSGLLGMALLNDHTAVVHYTTPGQIADVISTIDLDTGRETILKAFVADIELPSRGSSGEHHGGNPTVAADGSIFVGIGEYNGGLIAALPEWNGGKVWHFLPDGTIEQFARGFRNPFDMAWDAANQRLIVPDNGAAVDDEINIVHKGDNCGWPYTMGVDGAVIPGTVRPVYSFPFVVAPTGFVALSGKNGVLNRGYLLGAFVTEAIYYIEDIDHPQPIPMIEGETDFVIDVTEGPDGRIYFVTGSGLYELVVPKRGDCDGDGKLTVHDLEALSRELGDNDGEAFTSAQNGSFQGSWGCDANGDGLIDRADVGAAIALIKPRLRAVRP